MSDNFIFSFLFLLALVLGIILLVVSTVLFVSYNWIKGIEIRWDVFEQILPSIFVSSLLLSLFWYSAVVMMGFDLHPDLRIMGLLLLALVVVQTAWTFKKYNEALHPKPLIIYFDLLNNSNCDCLFTCKKVICECCNETTGETTTYFCDLDFPNTCEEVS